MSLSNSSLSRGRHLLNIILFSFVCLIPFFSYHSYPVFSITFLAASSVFAAVLLAIYVFSSVLQSPWILYAFFAFLYADINFDMLHRIFIKMKGITGIRAVGYASIATYLMIGFLLCFLLRKHISRIATAVILAMLLGTWLSSSIITGRKETTTENQESRPSSNNKPDILILVMDEHSGLEALDGLTPELTHFKQQAQEWLVQKGFQVYGMAFTNYPFSLASIPDIMNGSIESLLTVTGGPKTNFVQHNTILKKLYHEGYAVRIYTTTYVNFCDSEGFKSSCISYSANPISLMEKTSLKVGDKLNVIFQTWIKAQKSRYLQQALEGIMHRAHIADRSFTYSLTGVLMLDQLTQDIKQQRSGTVFFVHLPLPHFPYVFSSDCRIQPVEAWESPLQEEVSQERLNRKYGLYCEQLKCLYSRLKHLFQQMEETSTFNSSNILLLSDHGSRIAFLEAKEGNLKRFTKRDVLNTFVGFLAIRNGGGYSKEMPKSKGEYRPEQVAVAELMANYFGIRYDNTRKNILHLPSLKKGEFVQVPVPDFHQWKGHEQELAELQPMR